MSKSINQIVENKVLNNLSAKCKTTIVSMYDENLDSICYKIETLGERTLDFKIVFNYNRLNIEFLETNIINLQDLSDVLTKLSDGFNNNYNELLSHFQMNILKEDK